MSRTVWKFPLHMSDQPQQVAIPAGAILLLVDKKEGRPTLWYEVDTTLPKVSHLFRVMGTGWEFPEDERLAHQGSYVANDGYYVWHIYEVVQ